MRERLSVTVITKNEEKRIAKCLESIAFADEVLVVDSGSTDRTVEIARQHGARVIQQAWLGYGRQKQFAVDQAKNDWVLSLDADEWLSSQLATAIQQELSNLRFVAYAFPRCNRFMGRWLRHGEGYPDWSTRFFNKQKARWSTDEVHETVDASGEVGKIHADLMHESEDGLVNYLAKQDRYIRIQADKIKGSRIGFGLRLALSPVFRFVKFYFFRRGFLDGYPGLIHILIGCRGVFLKYRFALFR